MSEEPPLPGWWQSSDGGWHPPNSTPESSASEDAPAAKTKPSKPLHKSFTAWFVLLAATFIVVVAWVASSDDGGTGLSLDEFRSEIAIGVPCDLLFNYRNDLSQLDPSTTDEMNTELRSIGCYSSQSKRTDLGVTATAPVTSESATATEPVPTSEPPPAVCEALYATQLEVRADPSFPWSTVAVDGARRLLSRFAGDDFSRVWLCDIEVIGEYASPDSTTIRSVFVMPTVGAAPNEELPSDVAMWAEADSR